MTVVVIINNFHSLIHQYNRGIRHKPTLEAINRNLAILDLLLGDDISIEIEDVHCKAEVAGKAAIKHPILNMTTEWLKIIDIVLPITSNNKEIMYVNRRPYLEKRWNYDIKFLTINIKIIIRLKIIIKEIPAVVLK